MDDILTAYSSRAARGLLQWSVRDLCAAAGVSPNTVGRLEAGEKIGQHPTDRIVRAFSTHGVELLAEGRPGARVRDPEQFPRSEVRAAAVRR